MNTVTRLQLGLAIIGLILFAYGARVDHSAIRLVAIGCVAAASLLRFAKRPPRDDDPPRAS